MNLYNAARQPRAACAAALFDWEHPIRLVAASPLQADLSLASKKPETLFGNPALVAT